MIYNVVKIKDYDDKRIQKFYENLDSRIQKRINNYLNLNTKKASIIAHYLLKKQFENVYNINTCKYTNDYKIICEKATYYYNISHSKDYVAIVTSENPIGIDIEKTRKIPNYLINYLNNDKEKSYIYQNKYNIYNRFFEIFTLKESYLKMKRNTIFNIKKVILKISNNKLQLNYDKYYYLIKHLNDKYILAICEKK